MRVFPKPGKFEKVEKNRNFSKKVHFFTKISIFFIFFKFSWLREYAHRVPRMKLPLERYFDEKFSNIFRHSRRLCHHLCFNPCQTVPKQPTFSSLAIQGEFQNISIVFSESTQNLVNTEKKFYIKTRLKTIFLTFFVKNFFAVSSVKHFFRGIHF